ncbi:AI-2E family transporter [Candidatus Dojkabacteria bacterium]|uniref:AI-2E family transporter n=1 Tax=Candidatus Dojkabacteria bacterium TaxID=2099670 RepID=A0A847VE06_9BACT|nr:AI-2E family transporter [Candidatus Dojkabacteria bacterium]
MAKEESEIELEQSINPKQKTTVVIELSWKIILLLLIIFSVLFRSQQIITVLLYLFLSLVFMSAAFPAVNWLIEKKVSKRLAIFLTYLFGIIIILGVISVIVIPFSSQVDKLFSVIPLWTEKLATMLEKFSIFGRKIEISTLYGIVNDWLERVSIIERFGEVASTFEGVATGGFLFVISLITSIYLISEHSFLLDLLMRKIVSDEKRNRVKKLVLDLEYKLGRWLLGQGLISSITAIYCGIILTILKVPFALPLAIFTGFMDIIPSLGATVAGFVISLVALITVGPMSALILLASFILYQPIQNGFIIPKVLGNVIGLKPFFVFFAAIIALIFFGVPGGIIAVPAVVISQIVYEFYVDLQKLQAKGSI